MLTAQCGGDIRPWLTQTVRLAKNEQNVEFEYTVGEVPIQDGHGREVPLPIFLISFERCSTPTGDQPLYFGYCKRGLLVDGFKRS